MQSLADRVLALELALGEPSNRSVSESLQALQLSTQKLAASSALQAALNSCPIDTDTNTDTDTDATAAAAVAPPMKETILAAASQLAHCVSQLETILAHGDILDAVARAHETLAAHELSPTPAALCARHSAIVCRYSRIAQRLVRLLEQAALQQAAPLT